MSQNKESAATTKVSLILLEGLLMLDYVVTHLDHGFSSCLSFWGWLFEKWPTCCPDNCDNILVPSPVSVWARFLEARQFHIFYEHSERAAPHFAFLWIEMVDWQIKQTPFEYDIAGKKSPLSFYMEEPSFWFLTWSSSPTHFYTFSLVETKAKFEG